MDGYCLPAARLKFAAYFNSSMRLIGAKWDSLGTDSSATRCERLDRSALRSSPRPVPLASANEHTYEGRCHSHSLVGNLVSVVGSALCRSQVADIFISAMASGIVKIAYLGNYGKHGDFLYDSFPITIWTTVEICTAIIAASAPCLKPLFRSLLQSSLFSRGDGSGPSKRYLTYGERVAASGQGIELNSGGHVSSNGPYSGARGRKTESEEQIIRPDDGVIVKSMSVLVA